MKRSIAVLGAGLALIAATASAQPRGPRMGDGPRGGPGPMPGLTLTDEQTAKMADLRVAHLKETEPLRADLEQKHSQLRLELTAETFNETRVRSIQAEIAKLQSDLSWKRVSHQRAVRDLLTADQRKQFDANILSRTGGGPGRVDGCRRGMMRGRGGFGLRLHQN